MNIYYERTVYEFTVRMLLYITALYKVSVLINLLLKYKLDLKYLLVLTHTCTVFKYIYIYL